MKLLLFTLIKTVKYCFYYKEFSSFEQIFNKNYYFEKARLSVDKNKIEEEFSKFKRELSKQNTGL